MSETIFLLRFREYEKNVAKFLSKDKPIEVRGMENITPPLIPGTYYTLTVQGATVVGISEMQPPLSEMENNRLEFLAPGRS